MNKRIKDKMNEIERYLNELYEIKPAELQEYLSDVKTKAACERYFEKIVEATVDLALLVIKENGLEMPEEDSEAFNILSEKSIIDPILAEKLKDAKGMRNVLAHQYGSVNDELVFSAVTEEIDKDVRDFISSIEKSS